MEITTILQQWILIIVKIAPLEILSDHSPWESKKQEEVFQEERPKDPRHISDTDLVLAEQDGNITPNQDPGNHTEEATVPEAGPSDILGLLTRINDLVQITKLTHDSVAHKAPQKLDEVVVTPKRKKQGHDQ